MKIRTDLVGIVPIRTDAFRVVYLRAGDDIPAGITVGKHLLEHAEAAPPKLTPPPKAGPGSGAPKWRTYATSNGVAVEDDEPRDDVIAKLESAGIRTE